MRKPVALWTPQPRSVCIGSALKLVIETIGGRLVPSAHLSLPLLGTDSDPSSIVAAPETAQKIRHALRELLYTTPRPFP